jgi:uncharacterized protein YebE (UPF0316 family)
MIELPYYEDNDSYKRLKYVRYAYNFLIGLRTSYKEAKEIANYIQIFLKKELELDIMFEIKDFTKGYIKFLGTFIEKRHTILNIKKNNKKFQQRIKTKIQFYAPMNNIINKLIESGFMNKQRKGIPKNK